MDALLNYSPVGVRIFTAVSALFYTAAGITNLAIASLYTVGVVGLYAVILGVLTLVCEFSPFGLSVLMTSLPLLGEYKFRGYMYLGMALLLFGREMHWIGQLAASLMLLSGIASVAMHYICAPLQRYSMGYGEANNPAARDRYHHTGDPESGDVGEGDYGEIR